MDGKRLAINQAARFVIVSSISLAIDFTAYTLLSEYTALGSSWAKRISFACIFIWGFVAHKRFTFRSSGDPRGESIRFGLLYGTGWLINSLAHDAAASDTNPSTGAFLLATLAWACWNFIGQKFFVFRSTKRHD